MCMEEGLLKNVKKKKKVTVKKILSNSFCGEYKRNISWSLHPLCFTHQYSLGTQTVAMSEGTRTTVL